MQKFFQIPSILLLIVTAIVLIAMQEKVFGFGLLALGTLCTLFCSVHFRKNIVLIYASLAILGVTPITTDIGVSHMIIMGAAITAAVTFPYVISRFIYNDHLIRYPWNPEKVWHKFEILYITITATIAYFLLPFMLRDSGAYTNWTVDPGVTNLVRLFIGTNALGIWDELFFVCTVLAILRKHIPFVWANFTQAILFTSFLYELGFRGWAFVVIYIFALVQGYIFKKTESLLYVIVIHLTFDLILYLVLIYLHHPTWLPIFIT